MFSAYDLGLFVERLKAVELPKLTQEQLDDLLNCVGVLETAMITITAAAFDLNALNTKLKLIPDTVDINTAIESFNELDKSMLNGSKELVAKNLKILTETRISIVKVLKFLQTFEPLNTPDKPKIVLLS